MKTYNRYSGRTLRAHHIVKLSLILTLFAFILIAAENHSTKTSLNLIRKRCELLQNDWLLFGQGECLK